MDPTRVEGVIPSARLRAALAGQTVLLAFSRGKDSIAAWLALRDAGVHVVPYHLYLVPGLEFVDQSLAYYASWFGTPILNLPHPSLYRWLANLMYQPPERCRVIEAAQIQVPTYATVNVMLRDHFGLPPDTWVCDGVRAADSPARRTAMTRHGPVSEKRRTQKAVWDWRKQHVMDAIRGAGIDLPAEYDWFGRSFDGLDRRFLGPICQHAPADYARILDWFPLAALELRRTPPDAATRPARGRGGFRERAAREAERFRLATDSEYWAALCFRRADGPAAFAAALGLRPDGGCLPGPQLEEAAARAGRRAVPLAMRPDAVRPAGSRLLRGLLTGYPCTGDLADGAAAELTALLAALTAPAGPAAHVLDSPHHLVAWWPHRAAKDAWLAATGLDVLGDKYLDGDAAAAVFGVPLPARSHLGRHLRFLPRTTLRQIPQRTSHG